MWLMRRLAVMTATMAAFACADDASAQSIGNKLSGIRAFHLITEIDQECGVTRDTVRKAVETALRDGDVALTDDVHAVDMFVYTWTSTTDDVCATTVQLQVAWTQLVDIPPQVGDAGTVPAEVMAWRDATMFMSPSVGHARYVRDIVAKMAGRFAVDWRGDNR